MNLYDLIVSLLGEPPNEQIESLYYVLAVFMVIMSLKLILAIFTKRNNRVV